MTKIQFADVAILAVSNSYGIYAYQYFAEKYFTDATKARYPALIEGPESDRYFEDWEDFTNYQYCAVYSNGIAYKPYESQGDIWLVPELDYYKIDWDSLA